MLGRVLAVLGLLCLVAGCSTTPTPPHRYPMVDIPDAETADVALFFANSFRTIIASEQTKPRDQRNHTHTIMSADDARVVIKSENPDVFRRTGYLKLYVEPIQAGSSVAVGSRISYVQNSDSSFEQETDIHTAAQVPSPESFVTAYQRIFEVIAANFAANRGRALKLDLGANDLQRYSDPATSRSVDQQIERSLRLRPVVDGRPRSIIGALTVTLRPDGSVLDIKEANHAPNLDTDPDYRNLVQSYKDAIRAASPIAVARDKFSSWQTFTMKISRYVDPGRDAIRAHIERYWTVPASVANRTDNFFAYIEISIDPNGNVLEAKEVSRPAAADGDPDYRELLESCLKAIRSASPLPFPKDRYAAFKNFKLRFNPRFMTRKTSY